MNLELKSTFKPAIALRNGHLQTLFPALFRKLKSPKVEIETFELSDGDFLECYWYEKPQEHEHKDIVILFHGLAGSFDSPYIGGMMHALKAAGKSSVVMHFRGTSGKMNRKARSYHSGETGDAKAWCETLSKRYPNSRLCGVGYSLGGNMLLKLLGEWGEHSPLYKAVSVSAPMQLDICVKRMNIGFSKVYQSHLMKNLKRLLIEKYNQHDMEKKIGISVKGVSKLQSFWEFDDIYTGPIHGFSGADDYYQKSSSRQYLKTITTPTLILHALDDPFMTPQIVPDPSELSDSIELEISEHGGHVGFVGGSVLNPEYWLEKRIVQFLV